ncbi:M20/M25/M40 family metallo-hydrolase [Acidiphilium sp.]|jgi:acetylornithine deacetylase/succinyl-diaminopimelate desuccinylase-like protein|uniref:M20/M25/M40 family metallo-hydrolase n=1 Tax=Acidiphilium TaxID=522 RepID=UPI0025872183|nr:M20/M25/M40 family metallo-hydrolase [Acidiphilium sp.]
MADTETMPVPDAISRYLSGAREAETRFLADLVRLPSDNPPGDCAAHAARTAELLEGLGFTVERHVVPEAEVRANGMISAVNLVVRHRFGPGGKVIALNAHGDVVPPGEGWTRDPYGAEIVDGWMYGRGVAVSKSDFATYAFALLALRESGLQLDGAVELHLTYDEEAGGAIGPGILLREKISQPDLAIAAGFSYAVVNAHNGCLHLEVQVDGRSAHAAMPFTGVDALQAANAALSALYATRGTLSATVSRIAGIGSPQLTVGLISGGINTNVVPDRVTFRLDRRMIPEENPQDVEDGLRRLIGAAVATVPGARATIRRILLAEPLTPLPGAEVLSAALCEEASRIMGETITTRGVPLYTDARHYAAAGVPIVLFGAGPHTIEEANAHRADERLKLDDLFKATEVVARALARLLR